MRRSVSVLLVMGMMLTLVAGCGKTTEEIVRAEDTVYSVLQITDVHILNDEKKDEKAFRDITKMMDAAKPDLIVITGDITSEADNLTAIKTFGAFMEKLEIPWAFVYGNHDAEGDADKDAIDEYLLSLEYCVYERGDPAITGHGNYYRNVTDASGKPIMTLFMMDSNMYDEANGGYDHFHEDQIEWYKNTVQSIAEETNGDASKVVPVDKFSVVLTILMAFVFLHETVSLKVLVGGGLITLGTLIMVL